MSGCGSRRAALRQATRPAVSSYSTGTLEFEYNGSGEMQIVGPMTGTVYTLNGMNQTLRPLR
jgi:hypothetical protein